MEFAYKSHQVAFKFFCAAVALFGLQILAGLTIATMYVFPDFLYETLNFNTVVTLHRNLLLVWLLFGFMGAAYYIIPEDSDTEIVSLFWANVQFWTLLGGALAAVAAFISGWSEGRKFLEIPPLLDYVVTVNVLLFVFLIVATVIQAKRRTTVEFVLLFGLCGVATFYLPGLIPFDNFSFSTYFRWWVVHLWVEGVWELVLASVLGFMLIKLTGVDREIVDKWIYIVAGLAAISGIIGTGHHYYWIGTPHYWVLLGGFFSALEPLSFLGILIYAVAVLKRKTLNHPNKLALYWSVGCAVNAFVGAGVMGFAHTLPAINQWTHGTQVTAAHGHMAFWGAYAMLNLSLIHYAVPAMYRMKTFTPRIGFAAFWTMNVGMYGMVLSLAAAGIVQATLERFLGEDFLAVQEVMGLWFGTRLFFGLVFAVGGYLFIWEYFKGKRIPVPVST